MEFAARVGDVRDVAVDDLQIGDTLSGLRVEDEAADREAPGLAGGEVAPFGAVARAVVALDAAVDGVARRGVVETEAHVVDSRNHIEELR